MIICLRFCDDSVPSHELPRPLIFVCYTFKLKKMASTFKRQANSAKHFENCQVKCLYPGLLKIQTSLIFK